MNKKKIIILGSILAATLAVNAQQINPLTLSVINSYTEMLQLDPKDYMSYFQRGTEYYNLGELAKAEEDLLNAIKYTPAKENSFLEKEYSLLSDIYIKRNQNDKALEALREALKADPNSYPSRYKLGNLYLAMNRPEEAYNMFRSLMNLKSRSQEGYFGMAQAAAALGRPQEVEELIKEVTNADLNSYLTYLRVGKLYELLGQNDRAAANYLIAYNMAENSSSPVDSLFELASKDYNTVCSAIDQLIAASPENGVPHYLKASIAFDNQDYATAIKECKTILGLEDGQQPFIYSLLALSELYSGDTALALSDINKAVSLDPNNISLLNNQAAILMESDPALAAQVAEKALKIDGSDLTSIMLAAKAYYMTGDGQKALQMLNNAIMTDPSNVEAILLRGDVNANLIKDAKQAAADYTRAGTVEASDSFSKAAKALAKYKAGKAMDAESIVAEMINGNPDADTLYCIATYYAQTGNLDKAKEMADKAVAKGYKNQYYLKHSSQPVLNLKPIHNLL